MSVLKDKQLLKSYKRHRHYETHIRSIDATTVMPGGALTATNFIATSPLSWASATLTVSLGYNSTNLKVTASQINTIQDIATTSSPTFTGLTLSGLSDGLVKSTTGVLSTITDSSANWDTAYGWGDHSVAGYLTTATADTTYLKLDCSNDPLTADLRISAKLGIGMDATNKVLEIQGNIAVGRDATDSEGNIYIPQNTGQGNGGILWSSDVFNSTQNFGVGVVGSMYFSTTSGNGGFIISSQGANTNDLFIDRTTGYLGLGANTTPTYNISFIGTADKTIGIERETTATTAGRDFTLNAGGAVSGGTNLAGGNFIAKSGIATGSGGSEYQIWTVRTSQGSGTTDRNPVKTLVVKGGSVPQVVFGSHTATTGYDISFKGTDNHQIQIERHTVTNNDGVSLIIGAGGATSGATNKPGGWLYLDAGVGTGTLGATPNGVSIRVPAPGGSGTIDQLASEHFKFVYSGLTIGAGGDVDYSITFNANTSDGVLTWLEDEKAFQFDSTILSKPTTNVDGFEVDGTNLTTAHGITFTDNFNSITTGGFIRGVSNSADTSVRTLTYFENTNALATGTSVVGIVQSSTGVALSIGASIGTAIQTTSGDVEISLGATDRVVIDAMATDHTDTTGVFVVSVDHGANNVVGSLVSSTLAGDYSSVSHQIVVTGYSAGGASFNNSVAQSVSLIGSANDTGHVYIGHSVDWTPNGGSGQIAVGYKTGSNALDADFMGASGRFFGDGIDTIFSAVAEDSAGWDVSVLGGDANDDSEAGSPTADFAGGNLNLAGGSGVNAGADGYTTIGDGGTTDYVKVTTAGHLSFIGDARFYPRVLAQNGQPGAGTGATQIDAGEVLIWVDTDDSNKQYVVSNYGGTVTKVLLT